jgi:ABC-type sugar transport system substrate-binding protein
MFAPGRLTLLGLAAWILPLCAAAQSVVFINPGKSDEAYWVTAAQAMQSAARALGMKLDVLYAERDHLRTIEFARQLAARPKSERPDFAVVTNDNATGAELLRILDGAGVKTFLAYSSIPAEGRGATGEPRARYKGWLGSLEPHAEDAGYVTAKALIAQARRANFPAADGKLHMIAIAGDRTTPSSLRRNAGMQKAVAESPDVVLEQTVFAGWARDKAREQAEWLYARYPDVRIVWAGNDLMAFGAMDALEKTGRGPGRDAFFSGVNTSREAMDALRSGRLTALAGGHFITGAWSLVMLYDYAHGRDFADEGLDLDRSMFTNFDAKSAETYLARFGAGFDAVDFRRYSKVLNPALKRYDFDFAQLLR